MSDVFVLRNQHGAYLNKQREWITFGDSKTLFRTDQRDELVNEKVELTVKAPELRIHIIVAKLEGNGRIFVDGEDCIPRNGPDEDQTAQLPLDPAPSEQQETEATQPESERKPAAETTLAHSSETIEPEIPDSEAPNSEATNLEGSTHVLDSISS